MTSDNAATAENSRGGGWMKAGLFIAVTFLCGCIFLYASASFSRNLQGYICIAYALFLVWFFRTQVFTGFAEKYRAQKEARISKSSVVKGQTGVRGSSWTVKISIITIFAVIAAIGFMVKSPRLFNAAVIVGGLILYFSSKKGQRSWMSAGMDWKIGNSIWGLCTCFAIIVPDLSQFHGDVRGLHAIDIFFMDAIPRFLLTGWMGISAIVIAVFWGSWPFVFLPDLWKGGRKFMSILGYIVAPCVGYAGYWLYKLPGNLGYYTW